MLLYKYFPATPLTLSMLRRGEIYFATPDEQNDPTECRCDYVIDGPIESWEKLIYSTFLCCVIENNLEQYVTAELVDEILLASQAIAKTMRRSLRGKVMRYENLYPSFANGISTHLSNRLSKKQILILCDLVKQVICKKYQNLLAENKAVVSFSKTATNPTMWSHYAGNQKGFCLIYDVANLELSVKAQANILDGTRPIDVDGIGSITELGVYKEETLQIYPVIYRNSPPQVNAFRYLASKFFYNEMEDQDDVPLQIAGSGNSYQENEIGLVKSTDWKYEQEMRAFYPQVTALPSSARCLEVKKNTIKGVLLGPNCAPETIKNIIYALYLYQSETPSDFGICVLQAVRQTGTFSLGIQPLGVIVSDLFHKDMFLVPKEKLESENRQYFENLYARITGG